MLDEARVLKLDDNRRYTPTPFMVWLSEKAGITHLAWDVDVDADAESHKALRWFSLTREEPRCRVPRCMCTGTSGLDSLKQSWLPPQSWMGWSPEFHDTLWCIFDNPPFDAIRFRFEKIWQTIEEAINLGVELRIALVMPGNRVEQAMWQELIEPFIAG